MNAMLQVADCGPLESLATMFRAIGWDCFVPDAGLRARLVAAGCDTVLDPEFLFREMGYDRPRGVQQSGDLDSMDLYVDVKAQRNAEKAWKLHRRFEGRTIWYRINGGLPEITPQGGDELNFNFPIITPNRYYLDSPTAYKNHVGSRRDANWGGLAYVMWPPFARASDYSVRAPNYDGYCNPVCLIHNVTGWGYSDLVEPLRREARLLCFGSHGSPDGLIPHSGVPGLLAAALCMVHLKSNDCPGYALYEALHAGCPLIVPRRLIKRMRMADLLVEGATCLCFDIEGDERGCGALDVAACVAEVRAATKQLMDSAENERIGNAGKRALAELIWNPERDAESFKAFLRRYG